MSSAFPKPGDTFEGKYRIERRVGQGGFAQVFLAVQAGLERKVAIKMFDPNAAIESDEIHDSAASTGRSADGEPVEWLDDVLEIEALEPDDAERKTGPPPLPTPGERPKPHARKATNDADDAESDAEIDLVELSEISDISGVADTPSGSNSSQSLTSVVKRFEREARLVSRLRSPYTVTIHDFGQTDAGVLFMVMEYVDGVGFDELELPLAPEKVVHLMRQVLMSLCEAHNIGVLHRDLKPANMMLFDHAGASDQVKLLDFGVAKVLRSAQKRREEQEDLTDRDVLIGTPRYMSPEQILGMELDPSSDIYSFGLVVYELLTGERAIALEDEMQILAHHVSPDSFKLPGDLAIPRSLRRIVEKMLEKDPTLRYEDTAEVIDDLEGMDPDTSGITLRRGGLAEISQVIKTHAVDISQELKRDAAAVSSIAREQGWLDALKSKRSRRPLILIGVFLLVGFVSLTIIASSGDDARAGSDGVSEAAVTTTILTEPPGAVVFAGDEELGPSPIELSSDAYDFPVALRAVEDDRVAELTLDEAGGHATIVLPTPESEAGPKEKKGEEQSEFKPLE